MPTISQEEKDTREELSYLRQKCNSLVMRGHYRECVKLIEDNIRLLYFKERWPENFFAILRIHKKCYPSLSTNQSYNDYLEALLKKHHIPLVYVKLLKTQDSAIQWTSENFRNLVTSNKESGEYQDALGYGELLIKMDPLSSNNYLLKGWVLEDMGRNDEAVEAFQQALDLNETNYQAWCSLASQYARKDPKAALRYIEKAIDMSPSESAFHATRAEILGAMNRREEAVEALDRAIGLDPLNHEYAFQKGELLLEEGQTLGALRQYSKAVEACPGHIPSLTRLATLLAEEQPQKALPYVTALVHFQPDNSDALLLRAALLWKVGEFAQSARQYHRLLELNPQCAPAYGGLGEIYLPEEPDRALKYFDEAINLDIKNATFHLGKAQALEKLDLPEEAMVEYKTTVSLDEKCTKAYGALGFYYLESNPNVAQDYLDKAISLEPQNSYYLQGKGEAILKITKDPSKAIGFFNQAIAEDPANVPLQLRLAQLLEADGKPASAVELYRKVAALDSGCMEAHHGLARLLMDDEPQTALLHINKALRLDLTNSDCYHIKARVLDALLRQPQLVKEIEDIAVQTFDSDEVQELGELKEEGKGRDLTFYYVNRAIELSAGNSNYLCTRAEFFFRMGSLSKAMEQYRQVIAIDPDNHQAQYGLGRILADKGDKEAVDHLDKAISLQPENAEYHRLKAEVLGKEPQTRAEALEEYDKAIKLDKRPWPIVLAKAKLLDEAGETVAAMTHYRRVLLLRPQCLEATARIGYMLTDHNPQAALNYLEHALELEPDNYQYHMWRARIQYLTGDTQAAEQSCRDVIALAGSTADTYYKLALLFRKDAPQAAAQCINEALALEPGNWEYLILRGDIQGEAGNFAGAEEDYAKAAACRENCHQALAKLAFSLYIQGKPGGLEKVEAALALAPHDPWYLYVKASLLEAEAGDIPAAVEAISHATKADPEGILYQEKLVELLGKSKSKVRGFMEKNRLEKMRRKQAEAQAEARALAQKVEPPPRPEPPPPMLSGEMPTFQTVREQGI